MTEKIIGNLTS